MTHVNSAVASVQTFTFTSAAAELLAH